MEELKQPTIKKDTGYINEDRAREITNESLLNYSSPIRIKSPGGEMYIDSIQQKITLGSNSSVVLDGVNSKITVGNNVVLDGVNSKIKVGNNVVLDGVNSKIVTNYIQDSTYGLNGVFVKTYTTTQTTGSQDVALVPSSGGLLNVTLNYIDGSGFYKLLPGFNTASLRPYYYVFKSGGNYNIHIYNANITLDVTYSSLYVSAFFNSLESSGW